VSSEIYRLEPETGPTKSLVIFLHGYGANGKDLIDIGRAWQPLLPGCTFVSPDAPEPCAMNPMGGFQWFDLATQNEEDYFQGAQKAAPLLNDFLDQQLMHYGLDETKLSLVGFSQGTMMALHVGLRRIKALAGIVGYSGKLLGAQTLSSQITQKPPVLLVHGAVDEVIPVSALGEAEKTLKQAGVSVEAHISPQLGHGIDEKGLRLGDEFLRRL